MMQVHIFTGRTVSRFKFVKCFITCGCTSTISSSGYSFGVATKIIAIPAITSGTARSTDSASTTTQDHFIERGVILTICYADWICALIVFMGNRIVKAIRKHIVTQQTLSGAYVYVGVDESANRGIIICAIEVIESKFGVEVVASVAKGIECCVGIGAGYVVVGDYAVAQLFGDNGSAGKTVRKSIGLYVYPTKAGFWIDYI